MGFLPYVLLVMVPGLLLSLWAAYRVRSTYCEVGQGRFGHLDECLRLRALPAQLAGSQPGHGRADARQSDRPLRPTHADAAHLERRRAAAGRQSTTRWRPWAVASRLRDGRPMGRGYAYGASTVPGYDQPPTGHLSVAQVAVIAHEVGHAQQDAKTRSADVAPPDDRPGGSDRFDVRAVARHHRRVHALHEPGRRSASCSLPPPCCSRS